MSRRAEPLSAPSREIPPGLRQADFRPVGVGGLGDGHNAYAHSMAWYKGRIFVGTTRGNFPLLKARLPIAMTTWPVECPEDPFSIDLRAQILSYRPGEDGWKLVHRAPEITGSHGKTIPRDLGYRAMAVFQGESDMEPALYVGTWSPAKGPGPLVLRSTDGESFIPVSEPGLADLPITTLRSLVAFKGKLYTTPAGSRGGNPNVAGTPYILESSDPARGKWRRISEPGFGDPDNKTVFEMHPLGDFLYAGTFNVNGFQIWRSRCEGQPPYVWEKVITEGAYRGPLNEVATSMMAFKGALYIGSGIQNGGVDRQNGIGPGASELIRLNQDGSWDLLVGSARETPAGEKKPLSGYNPGFDNFFNGYFWRMCEHEGWLYMGTFDWSLMLGYADRTSWPPSFEHIFEGVGSVNIRDHQAGFDLYRSHDGDNWVPVTTTGLDNPYNIGLRNMVSTPHGLFLGTANPFGPRVWPLDGNGYVDNPRGGCEVWLGEHSASEEENE